jgi:Glycosyl hydrolase family 26
MQLDLGVSMPNRRGRYGFRLLFALACLSGCGGSGASDRSAPPAAAQAPPDPRALQLPDPGHLYHGVLPAGTAEPDSDVSAATLDGYQQAVGRSVAYVYFTDDWFKGRAFPLNTASWVRKRGAVPFIRLMMRSQREPLVTDPTFTLDRILAGEFDGDLAAWADGARNFGSALIIEYGTEVNGDWNPWSAPYNGGLDAGPRKFKEAYRHIVALMRKRGATNVTWALHYNAENFPKDPRNVPASYYPGDDVVDWVGISAYGSERSNDDRCPTLRALVEDILPQLRAATATKPLFIFEFGITNNNRRCPAAPWVRAAFADLFSGRWPDVRGFSWWQERWNNDGELGSDMLVQDDPGVTAAFRDALTGATAKSVVDVPLLR